MFGETNDGTGLLLYPSRINVVPVGGVIEDSLVSHSERQSGVSLH